MYKTQPVEKYYIVNAKDNSLISTINLSDYNGDVIRAREATLERIDNIIYTYLGQRVFMQQVNELYNNLKRQTNADYTLYHVDLYFINLITERFFLKIVEIREKSTIESVVKDTINQQNN